MTTCLAENNSRNKSEAKYFRVQLRVAAQLLIRMAAAQPTVTFNNGRICPLLGLGTYKCNANEVAEIVKQAINVGYRHFDCAHVYGNEKEIGIGLNEKLYDGTVQREDLFITSKLWNTYHKKEMVVPALKQSLSKLGLNYLDLYLIHWPMGFKEGDEIYPKDGNGTVLYSDTHFLETWEGLEECVRLGLTKSIGLSNFNSKQVQEILDIATIKPVNNQVECHPYLNQCKLIDFCKDRDIVITAYSPLGSPARPLPTAEAKRLLDDNKIKELADKYRKTPAQILIRYQIQRGVMVIPKSANKERIKSNFEALNFKLLEQDMKELDNMEHPEGRMIPFFELKDHKDYPFNIAF